MIELSIITDMAVYYAVVIYGACIGVYLHIKALPVSCFQSYILKMAMALPLKFVEGRFVFFRVDKSGNVPGVGLGLSLSKEIINLFNGKIYITSVPNQGSSVFVRFNLD